MALGAVMEESDEYHGFWENDQERFILEDKIDKAIKESYFNIYKKEIKRESFNIFQDIMLARCSLDWIFYGIDLPESVCNKIIKTPFFREDFHKLSYLLMVNGFSEAVDARCFEKSIHTSKIEKLFDNYKQSIKDKDIANKIEEDLLDFDRSIDIVDRLSEEIHENIEAGFEVMSENVFRAFEQDLSIQYELNTGRMYDNIAPLLVKADMILSGMDRQTMEGSFAYRIMGYLYMSEMDTKDNILKMKCNSEEDAYHAADMINAYLLSRIAICEKKDVSLYTHQLEKRLELMSLIYPKQKNLFQDFRKSLPDAVYFLREGYYSPIGNDINKDIRSGKFLKDLLSSVINKDYEHMEETLLNFSREGGRRLIISAPGKYFSMVRSCMEDTIRNMLEKIEKRISGKNVFADFSLEECIKIAKDNELISDDELKKRIENIKKVYGKNELRFAEDIMPGSYEQAKGKLFLQGKLGPAHRNLRKGNLKTAQDLIDNVWYGLYFSSEYDSLGEATYDIQKRIDSKSLGRMIGSGAKHLASKDKNNYLKIKEMAFEFNLKNFLISSEQLENIFCRIEKRYSNAQR
ncbi:hypothetical protein GF336_07900 [Candidatus Woesearchaeota archaeon]|nr:hypothetical protein [Candidatus Woesearchaeota archaeon]